ncbi:MAG: IclR family transcriptional regulator [Spirochaetes bacterium]|nr:IclR family transcriptional regulator [Spirochaetota bacterium]
MAEMKVQSLERAFNILDILARESVGLGLSEIAEAADLPRSTAFRLLAVLQKREYVRKSGKDARYRLGPGLVELSSMYLNNLELKTESAPAMKELAAAFGTIVFLACRQGSKMVYIDRYDQFASLRTYAIIGQQKPLFSTALGKALLLDLDDIELHSLFKGIAFETFGPNSHRDLEGLLGDLNLCRSRGWAVDDQENEKGTNCVAAPIYDYRGKIVSAISTSWSIEIRPDLEFAKVAARVLKAASDISRNMGWSPR